MAQAGLNYEKNWRSKISLNCPFKSCFGCLWILLFWEMYLSSFKCFWILLFLRIVPELFWMFLDIRILINMYTWTVLPFSGYYYCEKYTWMFLDNYFDCCTWAVLDVSGYSMMFQTVVLILPILNINQPCGLNYKLD